MINLHWCNGIIHKNSTLCCYEKEKHFPNMADWKRTVVKTSTRQRHSNFFLNVFKVDVEIPSSFQWCIIPLVDRVVQHIQQTDYMPDALLITSCSSLFIFTFGRSVSEPWNLELRRIILYRAEECKEATAIVSVSVCIKSPKQTTLRHDSSETCCMS